MLVAGGYGHSRLMESIFGGVTEHIVSHPKIPVLMVH
jgi:nucleotide-binding universal stress UspA family protein